MKSSTCAKCHRNFTLYEQATEIDGGEGYIHFPTCPMVCVKCDQPLAEGDLATVVRTADDLLVFQHTSTCPSTLATCALCRKPITPGVSTVGGDSYDSVLAHAECFYADSSSPEAS